MLGRTLVADSPVANTSIGFGARLYFKRSHIIVLFLMYKLSFRYMNEPMSDSMDIYSLRSYVEKGELDKFMNIIELSGVRETNQAVEFPDLDNNTFLHISCANNHRHIVCYLLECGADIEAANCLGWTSLMQAARHGHYDIVKILLENGTNVTKTNRLGMSALMLACASGNIEVVRAIIDAGGKVNEEFEAVNPRFSCLMVASLFGHDNIIRVLLDKGVNANISTRMTDITPLMFAAFGGTLSTVEMLLERGAKPDFTNAADYSAMDISSVYNKHDITRKLETVVSSPKNKKS